MDAGFFDSLNEEQKKDEVKTGAEVGGMGEDTKSPSKAKKDVKTIKMAREALGEELSTPEGQQLKDILSSRVQDIDVVNTLGYGDEGTFVFNEEKTKAAGDGRRKMDVVSEIVGAVIKNVSDTPIKVETLKWHQDPADPNKYNSEKVVVDLMPGQQMPIMKKMLTNLLRRPEFSMTFKSGILRKSPKLKLDGLGFDDLDALLESFYITFDKNTGKSVHSEGIKLNVAKLMGDGTWVVKDEYLETFGYLNAVDTKEKQKQKRSGGGRKYTTQEQMASLVRKLMKNAETM